MERYQETRIHLLKQEGREGSRVHAEIEEGLAEWEEEMARSAESAPYKRGRSTRGAHRATKVTRG